jgi:hypothetical protein
MATTWYSSKPKDYTRKRRGPRRPSHIPALLKSIDGATPLGGCLIIDISEGGARLRHPRPGELPQSFGLLLTPNGYAVRRCKVRWRSATEVGVQFEKK